MFGHEEVNNAKPRLFLLDGHSLFSSLYALLYLAAAGRYTNAVHGFAMMLTRLLEDHQPDYIAVASIRFRQTLKVICRLQKELARRLTEMSEQTLYQASTEAYASYIGEGL